MAGMDPKILAAVFASIAAIAVGTGGGSLDGIQDLQVNNPQSLIGQFSGSTTGILGQLTEKPEPENSVRVRIVAGSDDLKLGLSSSELDIEDFNELESSNRRISSDESLTFTGFDGGIGLDRGNETSVEGRSQGFRSSGVNFTQRMKLDFSTDSGVIRLEGVKRNSVKLGNVDVEMVSETDDTVIEKGDADVNINSFSGTVRIFPENMTVILNGRVDRFESGGTAFTG
jgi:hypothetical protein